MVKLVGTLSRISPVNVLVAGDFFLDTYTVGKARRISPEAPVAVVDVKRTDHRPGGGGNVVLNLLSLGARAVPLGRIGEDRAGKQLLTCLEKEEVPISGLIPLNDYSTPVKNRVIADNQQMVRIDHEEITPLTPTQEKQILERLPTLLEGIQVVAISDYGKGFLTRSVLQALITFACERKIPVIVDPKGNDFTKYRGATLIKPNQKEAYAASGCDLTTPFEKIGPAVLERSGCDMVMVTRSEEGVSLFTRGGEQMDFPVTVREVTDVTGAGDTVLAVITCAMANALPLKTAIRLCNIAAGIAIERFGCARVTLADLAERLIEEDVEDKVFEEDHLFALQQLLEDQPFTILALREEEGFSPETFQWMRAHKEPLLIYIRNYEPSDAFVSLLASIREVNYIIVHADNLRRFCSMVPPAALYIVKENAITQHDTKRLAELIT